MTNRWQEFIDTAQEIIENFTMSPDARRIEVDPRTREKLELDLYVVLKNADKLPDRIVEKAGWISYITGVLQEEFDRIFSKRKDLHDITELSPFLLKYALYLPEKLRIVAYGSRLYTKDRSLIPFYKKISEITITPEQSISKLISPTKKVRKKDLRSTGTHYYVDYVSSEIPETNFTKLYLSQIERPEIAFDKAPKNSLIMLYNESMPYTKLYQKLDDTIYFVCFINNYLYREPTENPSIGNDPDMLMDDESMQTDMVRFTQDDAYLRLMLELISMDLLEVSGICRASDKGYVLGDYYIPKVHTNTNILRHELKVTVIGYRTAPGLLKPEIIIPE